MPVDGRLLTPKAQSVLELRIHIDTISMNKNLNHLQSSKVAKAYVE